MDRIFDESDLENFDAGKLSQDQINMMLIIAIKKLENNACYCNTKRLD